ncbi:aminopeptidase P family N-terminal domain-containing protein [Mesorhizobium sp. M0633]|uniref:aminopeptidase P family N-terminal domain-containing protein n=1 Tax=Mesorhizobium sp. M0633 TaxID=2956977 RepID=UPI0033368CD7
MTGFVDRERATDLMQRAGIEALVLCEPEAFQYATGAWIGPAGLFRRAGAGFVVIPKRGDLPIGVVVADFQAARLRAAMAGAVLRTHAIWIESASLEPATADRPVAQRIEAGLVGRAPGFSRPATFEPAPSAS